MNMRNGLSFGLLMLLACGLLTGCFSSSGGSGGARPTNTYIVLPAGSAVPGQPGTTPKN
jgi:hypothetical protein